MRDFLALTKRNIKLFFKDKGLFFTSMVTPLILLLLYTTFLGKVYKDSFLMSIPQGLEIEERIINGCVGGQLLSSLLAVSCVTVAFCSNMLSVQDKMSGAKSDLLLTPVKQDKMAFAYYCATLVSTLLVALTAIIACFIYLAIAGWYLSFSDVLLLLLDVFLLTSFGTALSSIINCFLSTQGQISAVGTIVSAGYGFICGAYMPISTFSSALQNVISFLPGTYATSLIRNHAMRGALSALQGQGVPTEAISAVKDSIDCNLYFFNHQGPVWVMYLILCFSIVLLLGLFIFVHKRTSKNKK